MIYFLRGVLRSQASKTFATTLLVNIRTSTFGAKYLFCTTNPERQVTMHLKITRPLLVPVTLCGQSMRNLNITGQPRSKRTGASYHCAVQFTQGHRKSAKFEELQNVHEGGATAADELGTLKRTDSVRFPTAVLIIPSRQCLEN